MMNQFKTKTPIHKFNQDVAKGQFADIAYAQRMLSRKPLLETRFC
ncbi:MAG: hypothetical protein AB1295_03625 [Candidatus Micrarchaeota archaeon]